MDLGCIKVLVIDDQSTMRSILRDYLRRLSITDVIEAADGNAAFEVLAKFGAKRAMPDVIICDLYMEGMDGLEFLKKLRNGSVIETKNIPVLILTGESDDLLMEVCMQIGAARVLHKPVSVNDLGKEIAKILGFTSG
ncbi:MAG: response regulator [Alphaproteobacteria bacterium]|nr:response regulator [Alphaproteobacteria bacterium]